MILVDANILLYARFGHMTQHETARVWLDRKLNGSERVGLPWQSLSTFLRVATNPRAFECPLMMEEAWAQVEEWLACPPVWIPLPTERHRETLGLLLRQAGGASRLVPDARLAALATEHGLTVCSADGDFARFPGLRWENPLDSWRIGEAPPKVRAAARRGSSARR